MLLLLLVHLYLYLSTDVIKVTCYSLSIGSFNLNTNASSYCNGQKENRVVTIMDRK